MLKALRWMRVVAMNSRAPASWLRAESKSGGIDADVARMKLRALKQRKIIDAEELRRELVTRIEKFRESRALASKDVASAQSPAQTIAVTKPSTNT